MVRIRKNLTHSALKYCSNVDSENFQPHICRLNQSRWDVDLPPVFECEDAPNLRGSESDNFRATKSVVSPSRMDTEKIIINLENESPQKVEVKKSVALSSEMDVDKVIINLEESPEEKDEVTKSVTLPANMNIDTDDVTIVERDHELNKQKICNKNNGKGWNCKKEVEFGYSFCKHHLTLIRNNNSNIAAKSKVTIENTTKANAEKHLGSKLVKNMEEMVIAGGSDVVTSSATTVALEIDHVLPVEAGSVEVDEVKANGGSLRKRSRKMKNPARGTVGSSTFSS